MQKIKTVQDIMTLCPHSVGLDQNVSVARKLMHDNSIRHLPVQDGGKLVGIISDRDVQFAIAWSKSPESELSVDEIYTPEPYVIAPDAPLAEIAAKMADDRIGCALVVAGKKLVGIITTTDICRVFGKLLKGELAS